MEIPEAFEEIIQKEFNVKGDEYLSNPGKYSSRLKNNNQTQFSSENKTHPKFCDSETNKGVGENSFSKNLNPKTNPEDQPQISYSNINVVVGE